MQNAMALIKFFSKEEHYLAFRDGCTFLRTPHYYRRCEDKGRGDRSESCIGYWAEELGDEVPSISFTLKDGRKIHLDSIDSLIIHQAHEQKDSWLQSWCVVGDFNEFELSLQRMIDEFGSYFVVLPAQNIEAYAELIRQSTGEQVRYGTIDYSDNPSDRSLTVKDSMYSYQKEFRFYIGSCNKDEVEDKKILLTGLGGVLSEAGSLKLTSPTGVVRYFSQGAKEVVEA